MKGGTYLADDVLGTLPICNCVIWKQGLNRCMTNFPPYTWSDENLILPLHWVPRK